MDHPDAFADFYRAHARALIVFFTRSTFDAGAALDLTADTFASAFASRRSFHGDSAAQAGGWLFAIARRQLARYFRDGAAARQLRHELGVGSRALLAIGDSLAAIPAPIEENTT